MFIITSWLSWKKWNSKTGKFSLIIESNFDQNSCQKSGLSCKNEFKFYWFFKLFKISFVLIQNNTILFVAFSTFLSEVLKLEAIKYSVEPILKPCRILI